MSEIIEGLGSSLFVHNAIQYDYCLREAVASIIPICEEVVILDAQSTDGTIDLVKQIASEFSNVKPYFGANWEIADNYMRLNLLATQAKDLLSKNIVWHFMMQADEALHESSYRGVKLAVDHGNKTQLTAFRVYRYHLYGDFDHMVSLSCPGHRKPAGDWIIRLGYKYLPIVGDAENLADLDNTTASMFADSIILFHYGYMRHPAQMLQKGIDMTYWFGGCVEPDKRLKDMQDSGRGWKPYEIMEPELLEPIRIGNPEVMRGWINARRGYYDRLNHK